MEPLLDRLDRIDACLRAAESRSAEQDLEVRRLREAVAELDRRMSTQTESMERGFRQIGDEISSEVEAGLNARVSHLQLRFESEMEARHRRGLATFEKTIDERIAHRISSIERVLVDQSTSIDALRDRAEATDGNLQRLIGAIERLCERTQFVQPELPPVTEVRDTFQVQLENAMQRPHALPAAPASSQDFRPRFVKDAEPDEKKPRIPMARI